MYRVSGDPGCTPEEIAIPNLLCDGNQGSEGHDARSRQRMLLEDPELRSPEQGIR